MPHPFLTAQWANVVLVTYAVPPAMLAPYTPAGPDGRRLELDTRPEFVRGGERQALVSLQAVEQRRTRIFGVRWPGHGDYAQISLRFYVQLAGRRGVVFIREVVPRTLLAKVARRVFNGPYVAAGIESEVKQQHRSIGVEYRLRFPAGGMAAGATALGRAARGVPMQEHMLRVIAAKPVVRPDAASVECFLKERQWAFGADRAGRPSVFEMIHPVWGVYPVVEKDVRVDFASVFGTDWGFLAGVEPVSVILATGSNVAVFPAQPTVGVRWGEKRG